MPLKCFVIMGFGEKTDFATGRTLDLDKSYRLIIKKAVEAAGLECVRADEVIHSGVIDKPMYELLLAADVVVADLSTSNANALYELGIRHALRPHTTIVIAEKQFKFPFDVGHLLIRTYEHLGKGIDGEEAERVCKELTTAIKDLIQRQVQETDSPVYTFLPQLDCPRLQTAKTTASGDMLAAETKDPLVGSDTLSTMMDAYLTARQTSKWSVALQHLQPLLARQPKDSFLLQQLALSTYKCKQPDAETALKAARDILQRLEPDNTTDAETLGLWGAVHKRLWELKQDPEDLDEAIRAYEKGFLLKNDHYNGINLAWTLNLRAAGLAPPESIADNVAATRVRQRVIPICERLLEQGITDANGRPDKIETYWVNASLLEALVGTNNETRASTLQNKLETSAPENWMRESMIEQIAKLRNLLASPARENTLAT